jgi:hypothetical protein
VTNDKLTPVETRMLDVLRDGLPHSGAQLHDCLADDRGVMSNIGAHLTSLRKKLRPGGHDIVCEERNGSGGVYRLVRHLASPNSGYR